MTAGNAGAAPEGDATSIIRCYDSVVGGPLTTRYVNDDNTTDLEFSVGSGQLKWNITQDPPEADAVALQQAIADCVDAGGTVALTWDDPDGDPYSFTVNAYTGTVGADMLLSGVNGTGTNAGKVGSFAQAVCSVGGTSPREAVLCKSGKGFEWSDLYTGEPLTDTERATLRRCASDCTPVAILWKFVAPEEGALIEYWQPEALGGNAVPHDNVSNIFTNTGTDFTHPNGAGSHTGVNTSYFGFSTASATDLALLGLEDRDETNGTDQLKVTGWFFTKTPIPLEDVNSNTGERGLLAIQYCCRGPLVVLTEDTTDSTGTGPRSAFDPVEVPAGIHKVIMLASDLSAWMGLDLRDEDNNRVKSYRACPRFDCIPVLKDNFTGNLITPTGDPVVVGENDSWCKPDCLVPETPVASEGGGLTEDEVLALIGPHTELEVCTGPFAQGTGRTGWVHPWTPVMTANSGTVVEDWVQISTAETAPECPTDLTINAFLGNDYVQLEDARLYIWKDVQLLVDGLPVLTWTFQTYRYEDERGDTSNKLLINADGSVHLHRLNVAAGALVTVETRRRYNANAFLAGGRARTIGGLRAHANVHFSPRNIAIGAA